MPQHTLQVGGELSAVRSLLPPLCEFQIKLIYPMNKHLYLLRPSLINVSFKLLKMTDKAAYEFCIHINARQPIYFHPIVLRVLYLCTVPLSHNAHSLVHIFNMIHKFLVPKRKYQILRTTMLTRCTFLTNQGSILQLSYNERSLGRSNRIPICLLS